MKVTLEPGSIVVLSLDGTLVYVEDVQATFAAVVALPDQPPGDATKRVFTPGKVGAKKISPFSTWARQVAVADLSERNKDFIANYETWRGKFGPNYVHRTEAEIAAAAAAGTPVAPTSARAPKGQGKRALKRAAAAAAGLPVPARKSRGKKAPSALQAKCETCGQQSGHPNHPSDHAFVAAAVVDAPEAPRASRTPRAPKADASTSRYTLTSEDLTKAKAQPRGDKFNDGNRSHRVVRALASLTGKSGTLEEVVRALLRDGGSPLANPQKVSRRTLHQLMTTPFGQVVTRQ